MFRWFSKIKIAFRSKDRIQELANIIEKYKDINCRNLYISDSSWIDDIDEADYVYLTDPNDEYNYAKLIEKINNAEIDEYVKRHYKRLQIEPTCDRECPICMDRRVEICMMPCGHMLCLECSLSNAKECCICRSPIQNICIPRIA